MDYLIRFIQMHETFRRPETEALAELHGIEVEWVFYSDDSPFAIVRFPEHSSPSTAARTLIARSILAAAIYELWGTTHAPDPTPSDLTSTPSGLYDRLHASVRATSSHLWPLYSQTSFRFTLDSYQGSHTPNSQRDVIETFSYTGFQGRIRMSDPEEKFVVFEEYSLNAPTPHRLHLGRLVAESGRKEALKTYSLKKRRYIATTSMDAELSLVTANLALAAPGTLAYDPFMGTGSFPLACAHFGACVFGSDLDGRSIRGKGGGKSVRGNFEQYGTRDKYLGGFIADLTNTPLRLPSPSVLPSEEPSSGTTTAAFLDTILCDPPYGVREGLKVLGSTKAALQQEVILPDGRPAHLADSYIPPKRPYSFPRMLDDILDFASNALVEGGRLGLWMPVAGATAEDEDDDDDDDREANGGMADEGKEAEAAEEYGIPTHPALELKSTCIQHFNKWSRCLLTYRRRRGDEVNADALREYREQRARLEMGTGTADSMNEFRRKYFLGFKDPAVPRKFEKLPHAY